MNGPFRADSSTSPWGLAIAPSGFGTFGDDLLGGNHGDGTINAYDPSTGDFMGTLTDAQGNPIKDPGLLALAWKWEFV